MKILTRAMIADDDYCDYAPNICILDLSEKYIGEIIELINNSKELKSRNISFCSMEYFSFVTSWFMHNKIDDDTYLYDDELVVQEFTVVPDDYFLSIPAEAYVRVECPTMIIDENSVYWEAYIKYSDVKCQTYRFSMDDLEFALKAKIGEWRDL